MIFKDYRTVFLITLIYCKDGDLYYHFFILPSKVLVYMFSEVLTQVLSPTMALLFLMTLEVNFVSASIAALIH